jgi:hypothetical protein
MQSANRRVGDALRPRLPRRAHAVRALYRRGAEPKALLMWSVPDRARRGLPRRRAGLAADCFVHSRLSARLVHWSPSRWNPCILSPCQRLTLLPQR